MSLSRVASVQAAGTSTAPSAAYSSTTAGDLLYAVFSWNQHGGNGTLTTPAGWTPVPPPDGDVSYSTACRQATFFRVASGSETTISAVLSASKSWNVRLLAYHDTAAGIWTFDKAAHATNSNNTPNSGTTATTSAGAEVWIGALTHQRDAPAYSSIGSPFTQIAQDTSDTGNTAICVLTAEFFSTSMSAAKLQAALSTGRAWVGNIATFQAVAAPVNQTVSVGGVSSAQSFGALDSFVTYPTEDVPVFTLQMAVTSRPNDATYQWVDVSAYGRGIQWQRGRQNQLNRIEAGTGSVVVRDETRIFDPDNTSSSFYPYVLPMMPVRLIATIGSSRFYCFQHFIEDWTRARNGPNYAERTLPTVDAYEPFALADLAGVDYDEELSGVRLNNVLDTVDWQGQRVIADGQSLMDPLTLDDNNATKALQHIQDVASGENGLAFIDGRGRFVFLDRYTQLGPPYSESQAIFSDIPVAGSGGSGSAYGAGTYGAGLYGSGMFGTLTEYAYTNAVPNYGKELIFNDWKGQRSGGDTQSATDTASVLAYGRRSQSVSSVLADDNELAAQLEYRLAQFKDPLQRIESITVKPGVDVPLWKLLLGFELGDRITVKEHPPGGGPATVRDYTIQHLDVTVPAGPVQAASFTFQLWPGETGDWFIFDDDVKGALDANRLSY